MTTHTQHSTGTGTGHEGHHNRHGHSTRHGHGKAAAEHRVTSEPNDHGHDRHHEPNESGSQHHHDHGH